MGLFGDLLAFEYRVDDLDVDPGAVGYALRRVVIGIFTLPDAVRHLRRRHGLNLVWRSVERPLVR